MLLVSVSGNYNPYHPWYTVYVPTNLTTTNQPNSWIRTYPRTRHSYMVYMGKCKNAPHVLTPPHRHRPPVGRLQLLEAQGAMFATETLAFTASASEAKPLMKRVASGDDTHPTEPGN